MTNVIDLTNLIANTSVLIVISAIFILCFRSLFNQFMDKFNKMFDQLFPKDGFRPHHPDPIETQEYDLVGDKIHDVLSHLLKELNSDRAFLYVYHNGGVSNSQFSFQKMSCISEVVNIGVLPLSDQAQGLHKGSYSKLCKALREDGEYILKDVEDIRESDAYLYQRIIMRHSKSVAMCAIRDNEGYGLGFVAIDFAQTMTSFSEAEMEHLKAELHEAAPRLGALLEVRKEKTTEN